MGQDIIYICEGSRVYRITSLYFGTGKAWSERCRGSEFICRPVVFCRQVQRWSRTLRNALSSSASPSEVWRNSRTKVMEIGFVVSLPWCQPPHLQHTLASMHKSNWLCETDGIQSTSKMITGFSGILHHAWCIARLRSQCQGHLNFWLMALLSVKLNVW